MDLFEKARKESERVKIGYWSQEQLYYNGGRSVRYMGVDGKELHVTGVCDTEEQYDKIEWKDKVKVGLVTHFIRAVHREAIDDKEYFERRVIGSN